MFKWVKRAFIRETQCSDGVAADPDVEVEVINNRVWINGKEVEGERAEDIKKVMDNASNNLDKACAALDGACDDLKKTCDNLNKVVNK